MKDSKVVLAYVTWEAFQAPTAFDMINLTGSGIFHCAFCGMGTLLPLARNYVTKQIYEHVPDFTHVLYIDSDMVGVTPELVTQMLTRNKDIISPIITMRVPPYHPAIPPEHHQTLLKEFQKPLEQRGLIQVNSVGLACALIKRKVLDTVAFKAGPEFLWFDMFTGIREGFEDECELALKNLELLSFDNERDMLKQAFLKGVKLGVNAHEGGVIHGEDYGFCKRAVRAGYRIYMDTQLSIAHLGNVAYSISDWAQLVDSDGKPIHNRIENHTCVWRIDGRPT